MFAPVRQALSLRASFPPGLLASAAVVSVMFAASPFLLPEFIREFGISVGASGRYSSVQVATFAVASLGAGRLMSPSRRILTTATLVLVVANLASAFTPDYTSLVLTRGLAGLAAGTVNWVAWGEVARKPSAMGRVAAIGPVAGALASLVYGPLIDGWGRQGVFIMLAALGVVAACLPVAIAAGERIGRKVSRSRSNRVLLIGAAGLTLFGSAVFIYAGVKMDQIGAPTWMLTFGLTGNALAGLLGTRFTAKRVWPWFLAIALSAALATIPDEPWLVIVGLLLWGFAFWLAVPRVLRLLEERSDRPGERTGDAQGIMAAGRVAGPALGGGLEAAGGFALLGLVATAGLAGSGAAIGAVERYRRTHPE